MSRALIVLGRELELDDPQIPDPWPDDSSSPCTATSPTGYVCTSPDRAPHSLHIAVGEYVAEIWATPIPKTRRKGRSS